MAQAWRRTASLRLTHRISLGFLFVLAVMLAVGGVNYGGYTRIHQQIDGYTGAVTLVDATSDIDRAFFELRLRVREFVQSGDDAAAQRLNEAAQATLQKLDAAARVVDDSARRETLAAIRQDAEAYIANASKIVDLHRERTLLVKGTIVPNSAKLRVQYGIFMDLANMQDEHKFIASRAQEIATKLVGFQSDTAILVNEWDADLAKQAEFTAGTIQNIANGLKVMADGGPLAGNVSELNDDTVAFITAAKTAIAANKALRDLLDGPMAERGRAIAAKADELRQQGFAARAAISDETVAFMTLSSRLSLGLCVGGLALGLVLAWLMARSLSRPIVAMTASMKSLASGDKTVDVPAVGRADEIGEMAAAVQVFKENALAMDRLQADQIEQQKHASEERRSARAKLADEFEASVRGVVDAVSAAAAAMEGHATALSATAAHATKQAGAVASASETASSNVQTVAAAAEELSASIKEISGQVANSARIAGQAVDEADRTNSTIQGLSAAAQKIGEVVKLINDIASQTNLLALNATIEAARAGEAGKGFAVVASEVKNLATQTAKATEDIAQQITGIQGATDDSVKAIESVGRTIGQINQIATTVAAAVEEQGAATQEIARNVQQAAVGTNEVTTHIAGVTQAASDTGGAAGLVLNAANDLTRQSETLRSAVDRFLASIRAA